MDKRIVLRTEFSDKLPAYLVSIHPGGRAVYIILLILILAVLAGLPLVSVQVSVSGRGIIRPLQEKTRIMATTTGIVTAVYAREGERIQKSEPLIQIRSAEWQKNLESLLQDLEETESRASDLAILTGRQGILPRTRKYTLEYREYLQHTEYLELLAMKAKKELDRHEGLYRGGLISEKEYDDLLFASEKAAKELENFSAGSLRKWQDEYEQQINRLRDINTRIRSMQEKIRLTTIRAPATGSMVEFSSLCEGSSVQAGSLIGVLSPESVLVGEFYISSGNIAYLRTGQAVHLHMDAFPAREWGILEGRIYDISEDYLLLDNQPVYRVKCRFEGTELQLKNGYSAGIRKGMTFQAVCLVARRTLFQLLADKTGDWLHPALNSTT
jgi:HlyD family secretion protein